MDGAGFVSSSFLGARSVPGSTCERQPRSGTIMMSHHVQKKATNKHNRYRPKKHSRADIFRKPPQHNRNPLGVDGLPPIYEVVSSASEQPSKSSESSKSSEPSESSESSSAE